MAITYAYACEKIKLNKCKPLFNECDWRGVVHNKQKIKYLFEDENGHKFLSSYDAVANTGKNCCPVCARESINDKQKLSELEYNSYRQSFKNEKDILILSQYIEYVNTKQKLNYKCLICNNLFQESLTNITKKDSHGCIHMSKGERIVLSFFEHNGIDYNHQVYIPELRLVSDFEIKTIDNKIIHLEIDGDQHYNYPNGFHKTHEEFIKAQERDIIKDKWYLNNGHINIHIRYNLNGKNNDDINYILNNILNCQYGNYKTKNKNLDFDMSMLLNTRSRQRKLYLMI